MNYEDSMPPEVPEKPALRVSLKILAGSLLILLAVIYLIVSSTRSSAQYFLTVDEVKSRAPEFTGKNIRLSGAVLGDSIQYNPQTLGLIFTIAHISGNNAEIEEAGGLAAELHNAVYDPSRHTIRVIYHGPKPDLLTNEAQAILSGTLNADGTFSASEVLLKCPSRYEESIPGQVD